MAGSIRLSFRDGDGCFLTGNPEAVVGLLPEDSLLLDNFTMIVFTMLAYILGEKVTSSHSQQFLVLVSSDCSLFYKYCMGEPFSK